MTYIHHEVYPAACKAISPTSVELLMRENAVEESLPFNKKECNLESTEV